MPERLSLDRLERWMQAVLVHPKSAGAGVASPEAAALLAPREVGRVVRERGPLSAVERLGIYHGMYPLRMRDALAVDYPMLEALVGEHAFWHLVEDYVKVHPSRSYTLNRLGDHLPTFLGSWGPSRGRRLRADLARLELALTAAFDAEPSEVLSQEAVAAVPPERWEEARLVPVPSLTLLDLATPAGTAFSALKEGRPVPPLGRERQRLAVWRQGYAVRRRDLSREELLLLRDLSGGRSLGPALDAAARRRGETPSAETLRTWFEEWVAEGLFAAVALPAVTS